MNKIATAYGLLRDHGFNTLLSTLIEKLQYGGNGRLIGILLFLLHELLFLLDEGSIAVPSGSKWSVRSLPFFRFVRSLPALTIVPGSHHGSIRHVTIMGELYTYEGFVEVEPNDVVVDVGAYVGGFTRYAARSAERVICVEPGAECDEVLATNVRDLENVTVVPKAAWKPSGSINPRFPTKPPSFLRTPERSNPSLK